MRCALSLLAALACGCTITPAKVEELPPGGVYAPGKEIIKPFGYLEWMNKEIHQPLAVYHKKHGWLGYLVVCNKDYHDPKKRVEWLYVRDRSSRIIGCMTDTGRTYRFVYNEREERMDYIGTYPINEALEHLFGVAERSSPDIWFFHALHPQDPLPLHTPIHYSTAEDVPRAKRTEGLKK